MRISVFGLGYVGAVSAACFARDGFDVLGVDVAASKVDGINDGVAPIVEEGIQELVSEVVSAGALRATTDAAEAVAETDISMLCVGTPSRPNGSIDLSYVERVSEQIGEQIARKIEPHVVVLRSTVIPGTLDDIVVPTLERASGKRGGDGVHACMNPEFLREGTSIRDFYDPPFTLFGATDDFAAERLTECYAHVDAPIYRVSVKAAEMVKYACNAFHAVKVSFANDIGNVAKAMGIDGQEVMRVFCEDTKLNISPSYLKPGFAFGGSCLPKDVRALTYEARRHDIETPILRAALETNAGQVDRAARMILETGARRVGLLGLSFKEGTDDLRESPMVALAETLIGKGIELQIYDRNVREAGLIGANRAYIEAHIPHIWSLMTESVEDAVHGTAVIVLANKDDEFARVEELRSDDQIVVDLARAIPGHTSSDWYRGICW
ncbi:MAG: UDP-glucose/GDP-mannose dehydrogenase family protein [Gemmatimonadetes bacterium]|nr:UDP-glucose/GDP-mannose dehydrogenase family protein [Gemmatimonadota bacterium]